MANLHLRKIKDQDFKPTAKSMALLREHVGRAEESMEVHARENAKAMKGHRERTSAALASQAARPECERKMDAKAKVAADLARGGKMNRQEADAFVARAMERGDKTRGG